MRLLVVHDFNGRNDEELIVRKGDIVIGRETVGGWWRGTDDAGNVGLVPVSYCQPLGEVTARQAAQYGSGGASFMKRAQWATPTMMSVMVVIESKPGVEDDAPSYFATAKRQPVWSPLQPNESFSTAAERALQESGLYAVRLQGILRIEQRFRKFRLASDPEHPVDPVEAMLRPDIAAMYRDLGGQVASMRVVFYARLETAQPSRGMWLSKEELEDNSRRSSERAAKKNDSASPTDAPTLTQLHEWVCYLRGGGSVMTESVFTPPDAPLGFYDAKRCAAHLDTIAALNDRVDALLDSSKRAWMLQQLSDAKDDMEARQAERLERAERLKEKFDKLQRESTAARAAEKTAANAALRSEVVIVSLRAKLADAELATATEEARTKEQFLAFKELALKQQLYIEELKLRLQMDVDRAEARVRELEAEAERSGAAQRSEHLGELHSEVTKLHALHQLHVLPAVVVDGVATLVAPGPSSLPGSTSASDASAMSSLPATMPSMLPAMPSTPSSAPSSMPSMTPAAAAALSSPSMPSPSSSSASGGLIEMPRRPQGTEFDHVHASATVVFAAAADRDAFMDGIESRKEWNTQFLQFFTYTPPPEEVVKKKKSGKSEENGSDDAAEKTKKTKKKKSVLVKRKKKKKKAGEEGGDDDETTKPKPASSKDLNHLCMWSYTASNGTFESGSEWLMNQTSIMAQMAKAKSATWEIVGSISSRTAQQLQKWVDGGIIAKRAAPTDGPCIRVQPAAGKVWDASAMQKPSEGQLMWSSEAGAIEAQVSLVSAVASALGGDEASAKALVEGTLLLSAKKEKAAAASAASLAMPKAAAMPAIAGGAAMPAMPGAAMPTMGAMPGAGAAMPAMMPAMMPAAAPGPPVGPPPSMEASTAARSEAAWPSASAALPDLGPPDEPHPDEIAASGAMPGMPGAGAMPGATAMLSMPAMPGAMPAMPGAAAMPAMAAPEQPSLMDQIAAGKKKKKKKGGKKKKKGAAMPSMPAMPGAGAAAMPSMPAMPGAGATAMPSMPAMPGATATSMPSMPAMPGAAGMPAMPGAMPAMAAPEPPSLMDQIAAGKKKKKKKKGGKKKKKKKAIPLPVP